MLYQFIMFYKLPKFSQISKYDNLADNLVNFKSLSI